MCKCVQGATCDSAVLCKARANAGIWRAPRARPGVSRTGPQIACSASHGATSEKPRANRPRPRRRRREMGPSAAARCAHATPRRLISAARAFARYQSARGGRHALGATRATHARWSQTKNHAGLLIILLSTCPRGKPTASRRRERKEWRGCGPEVHRLTTTPPTQRGMRR